VTRPSTLEYRGRLAPSPTGLLHLGHASTFRVAQQRAFESSGTLVFRNEDLDLARCRPEFVEAMIEDLRWFGLRWQEGPDCGGPFSPYNQRERGDFYRKAFEKLCNSGHVYPCRCSRRDILRALSAPHIGDEEPIYPRTCRPDPGAKPQAPGIHSWRFRVPDGEIISFIDAHFGPQQFEAGKDFGDFIVWRHDDVPSYQLAVVVDDSTMQISEVVRGADLLLSTARQLLLYRALGLVIPSFYHCPIMTDSSGTRLAKRNDALSLRELRTRGFSPEDLRNSRTDAIL
jgi:glutamyl/glutaminyl-tRNA synthetase